MPRKVAGVLVAVSPTFPPTREEESVEPGTASVGQSDDVNGDRTALLFAGGTSDNQSPAQWVGSEWLAGALARRRRPISVNRRSALLPKELTDKSTACMAQVPAEGIHTERVP
jgi:hypothetical protein